MGFEEDLKRIGEGEKQMREIYQKLVQAISRCEENKARLGSKDFYDKMGDFFYSGNKDRLKAFEKSIGELIDLFKQSKDLANENQTTLGCVKNLVMTFEELSHMFSEMIPNIELRIAMPDLFEKSSTPPLVFMIGTFVGIIGAAILVITGVLTGLGAIAAFAILEGILMIITGIMRGYERKKGFEDGKEAYDKNKKEMCDELYTPLKELSRQLNQWFSAVATELKGAGLEDIKVDDKPALVHVLQQYAEKVRDFKNSYTFVVRLVKNAHMDINEAMDNLEIKAENRKCLKLWYYYVECKEKIDDIAKSVGLTEKEKCEYTVLLMLKDGKSSAAIAKATGIAEKTIEDKREKIQSITEGG